MIRFGRSSFIGGVLLIGIADALRGSGEAGDARIYEATSGRLATPARDVERATGGRSLEHACDESVTSELRGELRDLWHVSLGLYARPIER